MESVIKDKSKKSGGESGGISDNKSYAKFLGSIDEKPVLKKSVFNKMDAKMDRKYDKLMDI